MNYSINPISFNENAGNVDKLSQTQTETSSFSSVLQQALDTVEDTKQNADKDSMQLALGNVSDLAQLQINSLKATAMVQTTTQLTTRVVNAYKEIMQMQI